MVREIREKNFWSYVLLNFVTCGFYSLYFWYVWNEDVNYVCDGDGESVQNFIVVFLLGICTCGIYLYYWQYKQTERLRKNAPRYGIRIPETGSSVLVWSLLGIITCALASYYAHYLMITALNRFVPVYNGYGYQNSYGNGGYQNMNGYGNYQNPNGYGNAGYQNGNNYGSGAYQNGGNYGNNNYGNNSYGNSAYQDQSYQESMNGKITCLAGPELGVVTRIQDAQTLVFGQDGGSCNHIIMGNSIEAKHCSITYRKWDRKYIVVDYSVKGTYLAANDERLEPGKSYELDAQTVIYLGDRATIYRLG